MALRRQQAEFIVMVSKLIAYTSEVLKLQVFILEMYRTPERQAQLVEKGKSQTRQSKHLRGLAVDLCILQKNGKVSWRFDDYRPLGEYWVKLGGVWGGNWRTLKDAVHFEI